MRRFVFAAFFVSLFCLSADLFAERAASPEGEYIRNGNFSEAEFDAKPSDGLKPAWKLIPIEAAASMKLEKDAPTEASGSNALRVDVTGLAPNRIACVVLENGGFDGIAVERGQAYQLSFWAKSDGVLNALDVVIPKREGSSLAEGKIDKIVPQWKRYELSLTPTETYRLGRLCLRVNQVGTLWLAKVSLVAEQSANVTAAKLVCDYPDDLDSLEKISGAVTTELYRADGTTPNDCGAYSHHPHVFYHAGKLYAAWSNHLRDEDASGQRVFLRRSDDLGRTWTPAPNEPPAVLFPSLDRWRYCDEPWSESDRTGTSNGFAVVDGALYALNEVLPTIEAQSAGVGRLARRIFDDGSLGDIFWLEEKAPSLPEGFGPYPDLSDPKYAEIGKKTNQYLHDPARRHLPTWDFKGPRNTTTELEARNPGSPPDDHRLCEPTQSVKTADGTLLQFWRDLGLLDREEETRSGRLYIAASGDDGAHWSVPERSTILNACSRPWVLNLPDGRLLLINNPIDRRHLVLSISSDGYSFDRSWLLRRVDTDCRFQGRYKGGYAAAYQHACVAGDFLFVIYSVNKEDVEVVKIPLASLGPAAETHDSSGASPGDTAFDGQ